MKNRTIAFGDIHGCWQAAESAVKLAKEEKAKTVFLGDYVDRGPDSIKTLQILIRAKKENPDWMFLRGNHDQMLLDLILGNSEPNIEFDVYSGRTSNKETSKVYQKWKALPDTLKIEITSFLENTKLFYETDNWIFVHAPLKNSDIPLKKKSKEELLWNYSLEPTWTGKQFVHGHLNTDKIQESNKGININTSCGYGGILSGLLIKTQNAAKHSTVMRTDLIVFSITEKGKLNQNNKGFNLF